MRKPLKLGTKMKTIPIQKLMPKVTGLGQLSRLAASEPRYAALVCVASRNLGHPVWEGDWEAGMYWLKLNAQAAEDAGLDGDESILEEINDCRSLVVEES